MLKLENSIERNEIMSEVAKISESTPTEGEIVAPTETNQDVNIMRLITEGKNPRGIPTAKFIVRNFSFQTEECQIILLAVLK